MQEVVMSMMTMMSVMAKVVSMMAVMMSVVMMSGHVMIGSFGNLMFVFLGIDMDRVAMMSKTDGESFVMFGLDDLSQLDTGQDTGSHCGLQSDPSQNPF